MMYMCVSVMACVWWGVSVSRVSFGWVAVPVPMSCWVVEGSIAIAVGCVDNYAAIYQIGRLYIVDFP